MDPARISDLLAPYLLHPLSAQQIQQISGYLDLLLRWNARVNLTAVRDPESIVTRHFGESLFSASHLFPISPVSIEVSSGPKPALDAVSQGATAVDIGSGAGFPGIPIRIWSSDVRLTLIESNHKKVAFLREVCRALRLTNVDVFDGRAEDFSATANLVTLRAVERFHEILPVATGIVARGGRMALLIGTSQVDTALSLPSISWSSALPIPASLERVLLIGTRLES
ncbi:MAG TPA: 16S rRNA (guanine(527)-N(7))-methyltransferase RsmG [Terriglobales bacterium]|jgi:16S rRNA (guanine527-N7)-methyltransferase|nr:16S rRNA (guanine(527)-N(7))-methyltransferase RsmG [Terriglobales bacterium]